MRSKQDILRSLAGHKGTIQLALHDMTRDTIDLAALIPDAPVEPGVPEVPVEPDTPEVPSAPATGPEDRIPGKLTGDMTSIEIASAISEAKPGTTFECYGSLPTIRIGGLLGEKPGKHNTVAHHADGSPITDIHFQGMGGESMPTMLGGLLAHNSLGGFDGVSFSAFAIYPRQMGDRAAVLFEEHFDPQQKQGGLFSLYDCTIRPAVGGTTAWDSYNYKQAIVVRSSRVCFKGLDIVAPREHAMYFHNLRGDCVIQDVQTIMQTLNGYAVGPGRSVIQIQERVKDGLESYGDILIERVTGTQCCSEGAFKGLQGSGGAAFTLGGHNGKVTYKDSHAVRPMSGMALAVWAERENNGDLKGYREPAINDLELNGFTWSRGVGPTYGTRTPMKISNVHGVTAKRVSQIDPDMQVIDPWLDPRVKLNDSPSDSPLTPERVSWT